MTAASVPTSADGPAAGLPEQPHAPVARGPDPLAALGLVLDRELLAVRRHDLELAGRVPERARHYVDPSRGMLEFLVAGGEGGTAVLALAPGARGDTVVPWPSAPRPAAGDGRDVSGEHPFDQVVGDALEDLSRVLTHVERPDEMRGVVLHLGGRMLVVYADLWELRVSLLP